MKAQQIGFLEELGRPAAQFKVPPFQRVYSWTARQCRDLLDDVLRSGAQGRPHFMGTFLCLGEKAAHGAEMLQVIDGQQRITTVTLMLQAFAEHLGRCGKRGTERAQELRRRFLVQDGGAAPKLQLTSIDAPTLAHLLDPGNAEIANLASGEAAEDDDVASRLVDNLGLFRSAMAEPSFDGEMFWQGCMLLQVVAIELDAEDSPQEVFESLNSKGKRLAIEDLVRNAMGLDVLGDSGGLTLYQEEWLPIEDLAAASPDISMEDILCAWVASRHSDEHLDSKGEVYPLFKEDLASRFDGRWDALLRDLGAYAERFAADDQFRRDQMTEADRWLQGKPKTLISEHRVFGD